MDNGGSLTQATLPVSSRHGMACHAAPFQPASCRWSEKISFQRQGMGQTRHSPLNPVPVSCRQKGEKLFSTAVRRTGARRMLHSKGEISLFHGSAPPKPVPVPVPEPCRQKGEKLFSTAVRRTGARRMLHSKGEISLFHGSAPPKPVPEPVPVPEPCRQKGEKLFSTAVRRTGARRMLHSKGEISLFHGSAPPKPVPEPVPCR